MKQKRGRIFNQIRFQIGKNVEVLVEAALWEYYLMLVTLGLIMLLVLYDQFNGYEYTFQELSQSLLPVVIPLIFVCAIIFEVVYIGVYCVESKKKLEKHRRYLLLTVSATIQSLRCQIIDYRALIEMIKLTYIGFIVMYLCYIILRYIAKKYISKFRKIRQ